MIGRFDSDSETLIFTVYHSQQKKSLEPGLDEIPSQSEGAQDTKTHNLIFNSQPIATNLLCLIDNCSFTEAHSHHVAFDATDARLCGCETMRDDESVPPCF